MTLRSEVLEREQTPISYNDMAKIWRGRIKPNFVELDKVPHDPTVKDFFGGEDTCAVLCNLHNPDTTPSDTNHWICMIKKTNHIDFFDSLGHSPKGLTHHLKGSPALLNLSRKIRFKYNSVKLQKFSSKINDCGCFVAIRLLKKDLSPQAFAHWLTHGFLRPDISVSMLCFLDLLHI